MPEALFYEKLVVLDARVHAALRLGQSKLGYAYAGKVSSVLLAAVECAEACKEYPVVFSRLGESYAPMAVLGLRQDENLFVDTHGKWNARYIPAFVRRYPFIVADMSGQDAKAVCIDESYDGFADAEGVALFDAEGKPGERLQGILGFLQDYQRDMARTQNMMKQLTDMGLLVELNIALKLPDGKQHKLAGLYGIDEKKLSALDAGQASDLFRSGAMAMIHFHFASLSNFNQLASLLR